jgi:hypothetical protein
MTKEEILSSKKKSIYILEDDSLTPMGNPPGSKNLSNVFKYFINIWVFSYQLLFQS